MTKIVNFNQNFTKLGQKAALVSGFLVLVISLLSTFEVIVRRFLNSPTSWSYEVSCFLLLILIWLGATGTLQNDSHITVDIVVDKLSPKVSSGIKKIGYFFAFLFSLVVLWQTWLIILKSYKEKWMTLGNVSLPSYWLYLVIFIGDIFLCLAFLQKIFHSCVKKELQEKTDLEGDRIKIEV